MGRSDEVSGVLCAALLLVTGCRSDPPQAVRGTTTPLATSPPPAPLTLIDRPELYVGGETFSRVRGTPVARWRPLTFAGGSSFRR
jgi:hypothetical protein